MRAKRLITSKLEKKNCVFVIDYKELQTCSNCNVITTGNSMTQ